MTLFSKGARYRSRILTYCMATGAVFITLAVVQYPKESFDSAVTGLNLWWNVVFPALLPFFILSEILMGLGVVHFIGVLLEPLMRPLFNVPGVGAFALSMGLASGYPMDAVITCKFRKSKLCTAVEAERLLSFTNTADPLFIFGAVAVGMFGLPELGVTIALAHYLSSFMVGIIYRFHGVKRDSTATSHDVPVGNIIVKACRALIQARQEDQRSVGELLGDAVKTSMNTIMLIGGFIILFSVFLQILSVVGITNLLCAASDILLYTIGCSPALSPAIVSGLFEIDLGTLAASQADAPLSQRAAVASAIIAWSGLCVHGQVASIVIESGIRMGPYFVARLLHAILAAILTFVLLGPAQTLAHFLVVPVWFNVGGSNTLASFLLRIEQVSYHFLILLAILLTLSTLCHLVGKMWSRRRR